MVADTLTAVGSGAPVIFQGALAGDLWGGYADFLERVEESSALGPFSYEVLDTKLKRRPDPKHVLQLVLYSDLLSAAQGRAPKRAYLVLGTGEWVTLRLSDYAAYARRARRRLERPSSPGRGRRGPNRARLARSAAGASTASPNGSRTVWCSSLALPAAAGEARGGGGRDDGDAGRAAGARAPARR